MNHTPSGSLFLSKAIQGFINYKIAEGLSQRTIDSYERLLNNWMRNDYVPRRYSGKTHPLSPKTLRNVWVTLFQKQ